jgi:hypothetical protein
MKLSKFSQVLVATDPNTIRAREAGDVKALGLSPRAGWALRLMSIGGCQYPRGHNKKRL